MFFAGLAEVHEALEPDERGGFVIITATSDEAVDIHYRKPLVLAPEHAREWIDPNTSPERARELAMEHFGPATDFH